ncbi:MAG: hypothetical protein U0235_14430 [Polyangiaceae bacterium]
MTDRPSPGMTIPVRVVLFAALGVVFDVVLIPSRGHYRADSMALVFVALGLVVVLAWDLWRANDRTVDAAAASNKLAGALFMLAASGIFDAKLVVDPEGPLTLLRVLAVVNAALVATYYLEARWPLPAWFGDVRFLAFGAALLLAGIETIRLVPHPAIDVWTVQTEGARALLHGQNPFEVVAMRDTAPGVVRDDVPYVYPPLQILVTLPALLLGDVRYAMLAALVVAGFVIRAIARQRASSALPAILLDAPALLVWLAPKLLFIVQQAWIDPVQLALIAAATLFLAQGRARAATIALGCVLAAKQTMFWIIPLAYLAFPLLRLSHFIAIGAIAAATYLPFAMWSFHAWFHANIAFVAGLPARDDALSLVNWAWRALGVRVPHVVGFPLALGAVLLVATRARRDARAFGGGLVVTYFAFFLFNKWTFANYFFLLGGLASVAAALALAPRAHAERTPA